jgi:MFS family permease
MTRDGWAAFRSRDFRLYCGARFSVAMAVQILNVAVGWTVYDVTRDPFALAFVGLAAFLPTVLLVLPAGHAADRYDRRLILIGTYAVMMGASVALLLLVSDGARRVWPVYAVVIALGAARAFAQPAGQALLPRLVPPEDFANAVAWNSSAMQTAVIAGPALGGLLYVAGPVAPFAAAVVGFGAGLGLAAGIRHRSAPVPAAPVTWSRLVAGLQFIASRPVVLGAISLDLFAVLLGGATALMPIYARDVLDVGPSGLGLLRSMPAAGALLMAVLLAHTGLLGRRAGRRMFQAVVTFGLATIGFGLSQSLLLSLLFLAIMGAADMVSVVIRQTLVQTETPDALRGRVSAVNALFIGASNELGEFESGVLAGFVGPLPAVVAGGVGTIIVAGLWARWFPDLLNRDRLTGPA